MKKGYVYKLIFTFCLSILLVYSGFYFGAWIGQKQHQKSTHPPHAEQAVYIKPDPYAINSYVDIELIVTEETENITTEITSVEFADHVIPLKPLDPTGRRGSAYMKLSPGKYLLKWKIKNEKYAYPREITYSKTVEITKNDRWVYILIRGTNLYIS